MLAVTFLAQDSRRDTGEKRLGASGGCRVFICSRSKSRPRRPHPCCFLRPYPFSSCGDPSEGPNRSWSTVEIRNDAHPKRGDWPDRVRATIESTSPAAILRNDILDRPFRHDWGSGPVTLLGDAAHPMTPDAGQGAGQAIEDAVVLGRCMAETENRTDALRRYERERAARTRRFVTRSRLIGRMAQLESPTARRLRDTLVRATPRAVVRRDLARTFRFRG
ncbi:MAG: FAD-dependent monooxygenase [Gemmatimonadota bacterium]